MITQEFMLIIQNQENMENLKKKIKITYDTTSQRLPKFFFWIMYF